MSKSMKKVISLLLVVMLAGSLFTACGGEREETITMRDFTTEEINLTYAFWEDDDIFNFIYQDWLQLHPNCTITPVSFPTGNYTESLKALCASEDIPDVFGVIGSLDFAIESGMLLDMTMLFKADKKDAENVLGGINEYRIGNFGTEQKWATVIKFYPSAAFINYYMVENTANKEMPSYDWTWEEFEIFVESFQRMKNPDTNTPLIGLESAGGNLPVTWYPLASDGECIGEFGWTESNGGGSYNMENWADGLNLQRDWTQDRVMINDGDEQYRIDTYGAADKYAQDQGDVAVRGDSWYAFTRYFDNEEQPMLGNNVIFVPYMMPHMSDIPQDKRSYMSTMDLAGISANTQWAVECYHLLKYFTWGAEGWKAKLKYYPDMVETGEVYGVAGAKYYSNFPITLDDDVWAGYRALWAGEDDQYGRGKYFDAFFERAKKAKWTCLGGAQIPGFGTWLNEYYFAEEFAAGYTGVEDAVLNGGMNAEDYYQDLQEKGNEYYNQKLGEIEAMLQ